jgi:biofilm PGA synthesis N-glycosyltransferase PgaC
MTEPNNPETELTYAVITPVRDEPDGLRRLAASLDHQTLMPLRWIIVDNGSTDETFAVAEELARERAWVRVATAPGEARAAPGAPIVRAFHVGLDALDVEPSVVVKLDADTSMEPGYFRLLVREFASDATLGIASGSCYEFADGKWRQTHVTGDHVRGASRAYRWACLRDVLPLEERMGWDTVDGLKANVLGWGTRTILDLPFQHHRKVGARDGARHRRWLVQGQAAYFMGYRPSYLVFRALHRMRETPVALAMVLGYASEALRRAPRLADEDLVRHLREQQRLRALRSRAREATGRRASI